MRIVFAIILLSLVIQGCIQKEYYDYLAKDEEKSSLDYYYRSLDYFESNQLDSSKIYIDKALKLKPNYANYHYLKGKIYLLKSVKDSALTEFEQAVELKSFYPEVWEDLAPLYLEKAEYNKALFYFQKLAEYQPQSDMYKYYSAFCYNRLNQPVAALDLLLPLSGKPVLLNGIYREIIISYKLTGKPDKAIAVYNEYLKKQKIPECDVIEEMLELFLEKQMMEDMLTHANQGLQLCKNNAIWHYYRYLYFKRKNHEDLAEIELNKIEQKVSFQPSLLYFLGRYYFEKEIWPKSSEYWSQLKSFDRILTTELEKLCDQDIQTSAKSVFLQELYRRTRDKKFKNRLDKLQ
ncbi:MAG: hypothetical protein Kow00108_25160 [Calditrichia bacterium]